MKEAPTGAAKSDEAAAKLAWQRTLDWFNKYPRSTSPT